MMFPSLSATVNLAPSSSSSPVTDFLENSYLVVLFSISAVTVYSLVTVSVCLKVMVVSLSSKTNPSFAFVSFKNQIYYLTLNN